MIENDSRHKYSLYEEDLCSETEDPLNLLKMTHSLLL